MNSNTLRHSLAAFRLIPYIKRTDLDKLAQDPSSDDGSSSPSSAHSIPRHYHSSDNSDRSNERSTPEEDSLEHVDM